MEKAAKEIGDFNYSKGSLDEYQTNIRLGLKMGFEFSKNLEKEISFLKDFVIKMKRED